MRLVCRRNPPAQFLGRRSATAGADGRSDKVTGSRLPGGEAPGEDPEPATQSVSPRCQTLNPVTLSGGGRRREPCLSGPGGKRSWFPGGGRCTRRR